MNLELAIVLAAILIGLTARDWIDLTVGGLVLSIALIGAWLIGG